MLRARVPSSILDVRLLDARDYLPSGVSYGSILNRTNTIDLGPSMQAAIDDARTYVSNRGVRAKLDFPPGDWFYETPITIPTMPTAYVADVGLTITGAGGQTVFTQYRSGAGDVVDYSDPTLVAGQALLRIFGSYTVLDNLSFHGCVLPIYMGQDPASGTGSEVSFNRLSRLIIGNCGTAIDLHCSVGPGQGTKYNSIELFHIFQCQIGMYWDEFASVIANNNRNAVSKGRIARCNVGKWIKNGGTNVFSEIHCEGIHADVSSTVYDLPAGTPGGLSYATILESDASDNDFIGCYNESNDNDLYNNGLQNRFIGGYFRPDYCNFAVAPLEFTSYPNLRIDDQYGGLNTGAARTDALAGWAPGYEYKIRPMIVGASPFGTPATGLASELLVPAGSSSNPSFTAFRYGNTSATPAVRGAKTRGATADSLTVPNSTDVLLDLSGWAADGVDRYREGAGVEISARSTPSATNMHSGVDIKATPSGSLTKVLVAAFDAIATHFAKPVYIVPGSSVTAPATIGEITFEFTSNTTVTIKGKGNDGTVRTGTITLS